jgi:hypothetical protein
MCAKFVGNAFPAQYLAHAPGHNVEIAMMSGAWLKPDIGAYTLRDMGEAGA